MQKVNQKYTFTQTNHQMQFSDAIFIFLAQQSRNGTHRIVGYQRQRRIHRCLQKSIRWRYLMRQEVKLTLDSDAPWCLPALKCCLRRQHFSVLGCSLWPFLKRKDASSVGHICRLHTSSSLFLFQLTEHYICESKAYYNNLHFTKNNGQFITV